MTITLRLLGDLFRSRLLYIAQDLMTGFVCCAYMVALSFTILAIVKGKILISSPDQVSRDLHLRDRHRCRLDEEVTELCGVVVQKAQS